jgi:hypothetical protein
MNFFDSLAMTCTVDVLAFKNWLEKMTFRFLAGLNSKFEQIRHSLAEGSTTCSSWHICSSGSGGKQEKDNDIYVSARGVSHVEPATYNLILK